MRTIKLAAIIAVIAEAVLWGAYGLDKVVSSLPYHPGIIANAALLFHEPGVILLGAPTKGGMVVPRVAFIIFMGGVQFFILAWFMITLRKNLRGLNADEHLKQSS
ncbi:MAG: hypothetical protein IT579_15515 [Verrucomicrobia subdivision 3 bacterium]|nr:hypothetical protein [Limisphaerales bacterium]